MQVIRLRFIEFANRLDTSSVMLTNKYVYSPQHPILAHLQYISLPHVTNQVLLSKRNVYLVIPH
jgi:hypothetical protein